MLLVRLGWSQRDVGIFVASYFLCSPFLYSSRWALWTTRNKFTIEANLPRQRADCILKSHFSCSSGADLWGTRIFRSCVRCWPGSTPLWCYPLTAGQELYQRIVLLPHALSRFGCTVIVFIFGAVGLLKLDVICYSIKLISSAILTFVSLPHGA